MGSAKHDHDRIVHVGDETYEGVISDGLVLLDFWAEWCGPCKALEPVVEDLVDTYPQLTVAKIDADDAESAMDEYGVQSIPTMVLHKEGRPVEVFAGKVPFTELDRAVEKHV